jgi:hypothetical protein
MNERLKGSEQLAALAALRTETRNLHDAWQSLIEQRELECLRSVLPAMILFHEMGGRPTGAEEVIRLLLDTLRALGHPLAGGEAASAGATAGSTDAGLLALGLAALRHFSQRLERVERTDAYQRESLAIALGLPDGQEKATILLLSNIGFGALSRERCVDLCEQCIGTFERLGDAWGTALAQLLLADAAGGGDAGDTDLARRSYHSALQGFAGLGNAWGQALCLTGLANVERQTGHLEEAYRMASQGLDTYSRMGSTWHMVYTRDALARMAEALCRPDEARHYLEANLAHFSQLGDEHRTEEYRERLQRLEAGV